MEEREQRGREKSKRDVKRGRSRGEGVEGREEEEEEEKRWKGEWGEDGEGEDKERIERGYADVC